MKKILMSAAFAAISLSAFAGGFVTNTNQSVSFLRMPAQEAVISVDGAYFNPAGLTFMDEGFYFGGNWQAAFQKRYSTTTFAPFAMGVKNNGKTEKEFVGNTTAPIIPSFDAAYVTGRWAFSAHVGIIGGGGSAEYNDGLGTFEAMIAARAAQAAAAGLPVTNYDADIYLKGTSFYIGTQLNAAYKVTPWLSVAAGLRNVIALSNYEGYLHDIKMNGNPAAADMDLDVLQSAMGWSPILGVDVKAGKWNLSARYEFGAKLNFKNNTETNTTGMADYDDKVESRNDYPSLLAVGVGYDVLPKLHLYGAYHLYGDKAADQGGREDLLKRNCMEGIFGVEYDLSDRLTVSSGVQYCTLDFGDNHAYINDMSFTTNSTSIGFGGKYMFTERVAVEVAWFTSLFDTLKQEPTAARPWSTEYFRTSNVLSAGVKIAF